ncbi:MAG: hypothetical protein OEY75_11635, partial [Hylemonella sp.]|nr:hypothetical protein [Hylemonella sp.]
MACADALLRSILCLFAKPGPPLRDPDPEACFMRDCCTGGVNGSPPPPGPTRPPRRPGAFVLCHPAAMKVLFVADPIESFQIYKDSTFAMIHKL